MPQFSIIMPTYNRAWIIKRAIDSVLAQTFADFELIVVDDKSTDNTSAVVAQYTDKRLRYLVQPANHGPSAARNRALADAKGSLIAYLDSDNTWSQKYLETMAHELTPDFVLCYSGQNLLLIGGSQQSPQVIGRRTRSEAYNPARLLLENFIDVNAAVHRAELLADIGNFDESLGGLEDWDLFVRIAIRHPFKIKHVDQVLGDYYFYQPKLASTRTGAHFPDAVKRKFTGHDSDQYTAAVLSNIKRYVSEVHA